MKKIIGTILLAYALYWYFQGFDKEQLLGRKVVVTGASTGIGEQIAYFYCRQGAEVLAVSRSEGRLQKVVKECESLHSEARADYLTADFVNVEESYYASLVEKMKMKLGGIDTLVLNHIATEDTADTSTSGYYKKLNMDTINFLFKVNTFSFMALAHFSLEILEQSNSTGRLIIVNSMAGKVGMPNVAPYSATKHALYGYFDSMRLDLQNVYGSNNNVTITNCMLGSIGTENAIKNFNERIPAESFLWSSKEACAESIVVGGEAGYRDVYFPLYQVLPSSLMLPFGSIVDIIVGLV